MAVIEPGTAVVILGGEMQLHEDQPTGKTPSKQLRPLPSVRTPPIPQNVRMDSGHKSLARHTETRIFSLIRAFRGCLIRWSNKNGRLSNLYLIKRGVRDRLSLSCRTTPR